jgi:endonuclease V-like protein UPF0215 family
VNVIGFDDGPFAREHRGDVLLIGAVCSRTRLDGIVSGRVQRDGWDSTRRMIHLVERSPFRAHVRAVMLQGIAVGGFNVVDVHELSRALRIPVLVVTRRQPDLEAVRRALFSDVPSGRPPVPGARRKWRLIERAGAVEPLGMSHRATLAARAANLAVGPVAGPTGLKSGGPRLWIQRAGLTLAEARVLVAATTLHGNIPEPLRLAHIVAGGVVTGRSRGRA